ncbi:pyridoxamine 5'-phosphate oxidase family protein [Ectobacillus ponti]|uniref:Pyridoxamine 5'-phosphate oxidase family protein n=1 Tax=Ectobacillus ponti TaxID=2961894 RepID=A0AA41XEA9_9BACI|nr:pyridoxamine 5'-phosphate oxidase family protein [Ectobacillus ponti]MCP8971333.1 pyridoxamine 5'-phosphate oxidase family protein [Ectobacillus ponti]
MNPMRYAKRECTDRGRIDAFLRQAKTGFLGLSDEEGPYVIPLNFAYYNGAIYFHGAAEGRKIDMMKQNNRVCFTISEEYGTIADPIPAHTDTAYMSVILFGESEEVTDLDEATAAMQCMLDKYVPGYYDQPLAKSHVERYRSSKGSRTAVFKIVPTSLSAKENVLNEEASYYPGRTIGADTKPC